MTTMKKIFALAIAVFLTFVGIAFSGARIVDTVPQVADGQVLAIHGRTAIWGIEQALKSSANTGILQYNQTDLYLFWWKGSGGMYSTFVDFKNQRVIESLKEISRVGGNFTNAKTFQEFVHELEANGWKSIPASAVPSAFRTLFSLGTSWIITLSQSSISVFVVPASSLDQHLLETTYPRIQQ